MLATSLEKDDDCYFILGYGEPDADNCFKIPMSIYKNEEFKVYKKC